MPSGLFGVSISGLNAAQTGLLTASHNIANVNTPGYSRQQIEQGTRIPQLTGSGFIGSGTNVETVRRLYDDFLNQQVASAESQGAALDAFNAQIRQINDLLADPSVGLSPSLQEFFEGVQDLADNPGTTVTRQALLGSAEGLVSRFRLIDQRVGELAVGTNQRIASTVTEINSFAQELARMNDRIALAESNSLQPANDLRDTREQLVVELNRRIGATVVRQGNSYNVFVAGGIPVVVGGNAFSLSVQPSPTDPSRSVVGVSTPGGTTLIQEARLQGGSLGGLLEFRSQSLDSVRNAAGRIAIGLAETFNAQHQLGQDLIGAIGGNFFSVPAPVVNSSSLNTGNGLLDAQITTVGALTTSDYLVMFDGANWLVTRLSDSTQQVFGALPAVVDGVTLSLASGAPAAGDQFLLRPTVGGAGGLDVVIIDPTKIAAAAPIRTGRPAANTGTASISAGTVNPPAPTDPNLQAAVTITFTSPNTFDVVGTGTGDPTGVAYVSGSDIVFNGWTVQITGVPEIGDVFTVGSNANGIADNRNALLLATLQTQNLFDNATATFQGAYGQLVSDVGNDTRQSDIGSTAQAIFLDQARTAQQSVSGVNLDEEAANLVRYQQAYQASAKVIQIGSRLFEDLIAAMG